MLSTYSSLRKLFSNSKFHYSIGLFLLSVLQLWSTWKGMGKTYDSFHYLEAAQSLIQTKGAINSQSYMTWALGFPFLLTLFNDSILLNLFCLLGSYTFYFHLSEKLFQSTTTKWWLTLAFAFATPLYLIHHFVWSEAPFVLFLLGCIWSFYFLNETYFSKRYILLFSLFGFLFMSMRNAGLYFITSINIGVFLFYILPLVYKKEKKIRFLITNIYTKVLILFSVFSSVSIFFWWLRAKPTTAGKFATMYSLAERTFSEEIINYGDILSRWLVPSSIPLTFRLVFFCIFLVSFGIAFFIIFIKYSKENTSKTSQFIFFIAWIVSFYLIGMLITRTGMRVDVERYLAILYPFLCIIIGYIVEKTPIRLTIKYTIAFLWLIYPLLRTLKNILFWNAVS